MPKNMRVSTVVDVSTLLAVGMDIKLIQAIANRVVERRMVFDEIRNKWVNIAPSNKPVKPPRKRKKVEACLLANCA